MITDGDEWQTGPDFFKLHEEMFGDKFYWNVVNVIGMIVLCGNREPITVTDIGGATGNFTQRLLAMTEVSRITIFERDKPLFEESQKTFAGNERVMIVPGDIFEDPIPKSTIATMLNVSGYFDVDKILQLFEALNSKYFIANFLIAEDNTEDVQHPDYKLLRREDGKLTWDIGLGQDFSLWTVSINELYRISRKCGYKPIFEWRYTDFKSERLIVFEREKLNEENDEEMHPDTLGWIG